jgi:hypothetical protein
MSSWACPACCRRSARYPGEDQVREVCWLCWVERFPTAADRERELVRRGMPAEYPHRMEVAQG